MNTPIIPDDERLNNTLHAFEIAMMTPVVSGELVPWVSTADEALELLCGEFYHRLGVLHPLQLRLIRRELDDLDGCQQKLITEDTLIGKQLTSVRHQIDSLARRAEQVGSDEARVVEQQHLLVTSGLDLVLQIRKQETALATWLWQALNHDMEVKGDNDA